MDTKQEADMGVTKESFGFLEDKREAFLYTIENQNGFAVKVTDFGVNIVSLLVKNKEGNIKDVALGYDTLEEYFENGICLIEWGELISDALPSDFMHITFEKDSKNEDLRILNIQTYGNKFNSYFDEH